MPYFLIFLLLTACTAPKAEAKKEAATLRADAAHSANEVLKEMNDKDATSALIAAYKRTNTAPAPRVLITNHLDELEWVNPLDYTNSAIEEPDLLDAIPFDYYYDNELYVLYRHENTPFTNEYNVFFSNQLVKYGRDIQGRRIINSKAHYIFERDVLNYE